MADWTTPLIKVQRSALAFWNTYLRDNMTHIKAPPNEQYAPAYANTTTTTASTTFADISSDYSLDITTFGGDILVSFSCFADTACFDISVNGSRQGGNDGIQQANSGGASIQLLWPVFGLAPGTHTISIQWKTNGGTATIDNEFMPYFNVREFS